MSAPPPGMQEVTGTKYTGDLGKDDVEKCEESFNLIDVDGSGEIDINELERAMRMLVGNTGNPEEISGEVVDAMLMTLDKDRNSQISLEEFKMIWTCYVQHKDEQGSAEAPMTLFPKTKDKLLSLFLIFDDPHTSKVSHWVSIFIMTTIILSVTCFVLESVPALRYWDGGAVGRGRDTALPAFEYIETYSIVVFTVEYLVRFFIVGMAPPFHVQWWKKTIKFVMHPMNIIDFIAILPFYIGLVAKGAGATESSSSGLGGPSSTSGRAGVSNLQAWKIFKRPADVCRRDGEINRGDATANLFSRDCSDSLWKPHLRVRKGRVERLPRRLRQAGRDWLGTRADTFHVDPLVLLVGARHGYNCGLRRQLPHIRAGEGCWGRHNDARDFGARAACVDNRVEL